MDRRTFDAFVAFFAASRWQDSYSPVERGLGKRQTAHEEETRMVLEAVRRHLQQEDRLNDEMVWRLHEDPPSLAVRLGSTCELLLEDMGGEVLVSVAGCAVSGVLPPREQIVLTLLQRVDTAEVIVIRSSLGPLKLGSWLEVGGIPLVYRATHSGTDRVLSMLPGYRERREAACHQTPQRSAEPT